MGEYSCGQINSGSQFGFYFKQKNSKVPELQMFESYDFDTSFLRSRLAKKLFGESLNMVASLPMWIMNSQKILMSGQLIMRPSVLMTQGLILRLVLFTTF